MNKTLLLSLGLAAGLSSAAFGQTTIAYWAQNSNTLPSGDFGLNTASFPQSADLGSGTLTVGGVTFSTTNDATDGDVYDSLQSFGGTTVNALTGFGAGGSFSPQGGDSQENNGMYFDLNVDLSLFEDITVSWAQRGTGSGFDSREFSYSANGGSSFTSFATDTGTLGSSFVVESYDLSAISGIEGASSAVFRVTLDGATGSTGNNRFDNILISGTQIPEPSAAGILALTAAGFLGLRRRRS